MVWYGDKENACFNGMKMLKERDKAEFAQIHC